MWNVFNAPANSFGADDCLRFLLEASGNLDFVAGDFNLRHPLWDSHVTSTSQEATALIDWAGEKSLSLLNPSDVSTHNRGGTLDLVFCSHAGAKCEIPLDLHITSDHETSVTTIPMSGEANKDNAGRLRYNSLYKELFLRILGHRHELPNIQTNENANAEAGKIVEIIHTALLAACPRAKGNQRGTVWWNEECRDAARRYRLARLTGLSKDEKRDLRNAVRRAKKVYWNSRVEKLQNVPDVYKVVKWHNTAPKYNTPPLKEPNGDTVVCCPKKKRLNSYIGYFSLGIWKQ